MIGYHYFRYNDFNWRRHNQALIPLHMPHIAPTMGLIEVKKMLFRHRSILARWDENFDQLSGGEWWHVIKDEPEEIAGLSTNTRSKVRRGQKRFHAEIVDRKSILDGGYDVYKSAFDRYETFESVVSETEFKEAILSLPPETQFWAAWDMQSNRMVAFSENLVSEQACIYMTLWFEPKALKRYVGYLLIHEMNKYYLNQCRLRYVSDGARNISHQTNIHDFLRHKFGFRRAYSRLRVVYFPGLGVVVKLLYPLRKYIGQSSATLFRKAAILLEQERIRRACLEPWERK